MLKQKKKQDDYLLKNLVIKKISINFAPSMKRNKRHISAWILLAVFVPMLILSSLHVHHGSLTAEKECAECVHHHCNGHITQGTETIHHCVLCQFLSITFYAAAIAAVLFYSHTAKTTYARKQCNLRLACRGFISLRAPPFV